MPLAESKPGPMQPSAFRARRRGSYPHRRGSPVDFIVRVGLSYLGKFLRQ